MSFGYSPFKFLEPYHREDKENFFGRDVEIEALYEMVFETNFILVYGESGTGKTSLINAGLAGRFESADWLDINIRRTNHDINTTTMEEIRRKARSPISENATLVEAVESIFLDYYKPVYLIFDQLEELFINDLGSTKDERQTFAASINALIEADLQCKVLFVMREEFLAKLNEFEKGAMPYIYNKRLRVERMTPGNVREVILKTCEWYGIEVEEPEITADKIIAKISHGFGVQLAYLQIYLDKLYQNAVHLKSA